MGFILPQEVETHVSSRTYQYWEDKGYDVPKKVSAHNKHKMVYDYKTPFKVSITDLTKWSHIPFKFICDGCGKELTICMAEYNMNQHDGKYYCHKCANAILNSGENNPRWNPTLTQEEHEYRRKTAVNKEFVKKIMFRDDFTCQVCGVKSNGKNLEVHHLNGYNWCKDGRYDETNGILLCKDCHSSFHNHYGRGNNTKEQFEEWFGKSVNLIKYDKELPKFRQIINIDTQQIYTSQYEINKLTGVSVSTIEFSCRYKTRLNCCPAYMWLDEYQNLEPWEIVLYKAKQPYCHQIVCLENGEVYSGCKDAAKKSGVSINTVNRRLNGDSKKWVIDIHFVYASDFLSYSPEQKQQIKSEYSNSWNDSSFLFLYFNLKKGGL